MSDLEPHHDNRECLGDFRGSGDHGHGVGAEDEHSLARQDADGHADLIAVSDIHPESSTHPVLDSHSAFVADVHDHRAELAAVMIDRHASDVAAADAYGHADDQSVFFGHPDGDGFAAQTTPFTCGVMTQKMVLDAYGRRDGQMGRPLSEAGLLYDAMSHGWVTGHGMPLRHLGELLELHGVPMHHGHSAAQMLNDLAAGRQVIVPVDSHKLWSRHDDVESYGRVVLDHVVVLRGIRVDEHGHTHVVVNDPGRDEGAGNEYDVDHFRSALDRPHLDFVATDHAPPGWVPAGVETGHIVDQSHQPETFKHVVEQLSGAERHEFFRRI
jgi:hypothetical protein